MAGLDDYGGLIASARNAAPDYATQEAQAQLRAIQGGALKLQMQKAAQQIAGEQAYKADMTAYLADPNPAAAARLIALHPDRAEPIKNSFDMMDKAKKTADLQGISEIYSAAKSGSFELAATLAQRRLDADKAAGDPDTAMDEHIIKGLRSSNPVEQKAALGMLEFGLQVITDGKLGGKEKGGYTLEAGATRFGDDGQIVAQSPYIKTADGGMLIAEGGGQPSDQSGPAPTTPARTDLPAPQAAVASVLSTVMPAHVVSGFLGNFEAEGGYGGAKGDGGSAHGLAQWRKERQANFQRVIGKPIGDSSVEDQARFVLHEMQNPQEAGMTVEQRDRILAARSPQEAAVLIDKFYERSSGEHRQKRIDAAVRYHGGGSGGGASAAGAPAPPGYRWLTPPKGREAPSGMRWTADGNLEKIPVAGEPEPRRMTAAEVQAEGLNPNVVYYRNKDGVPTAVSGQDTRTTASRPIPQAVENKAKPLIDARDSLSRVNQTWKDEFGGYTVTGGLTNWVQGKTGIGPEGQREWWADFKSMDNQIRNDLFGSALTATEKAAYEATTIDPSMKPSQIRQNLQRRAKIVSQAVARTKNYLVKNRFDPEAVDALFAPLGGETANAAPSNGAAPVRVRSIQEANRLAPGTLYVTPAGKVIRR